MNSFLIIGAHVALGYVFIVQSYLAYKQLTKERPLTFLELFMYMENTTDKSVDKILQVIKEESTKTQNQSFENSLRVSARIKKIMEDEKLRKDD